LCHPFVCKMIIKLWQS